MWILKIPNSSMKDKISTDRRKLVDYVKNQIETAHVAWPQEWDRDNYVDNPDIFTYICSKGHKIGTIEWIEEIPVE